LTGSFPIEYHLYGFPGANFEMLHGKQNLG
jgi:hypothetical protein